MRVRLALALALLVGALFGLSTSVGLAASTPVGLAVPAAGEPPASDRAAQLAAIEQAARLLHTRFFEPVDSASLLNAAIDGANAELKRQGANLTLRRVSFTHDLNADWSLFAAAYAGAADGYASAINEPALSAAVIRAMAESLKDCHTYYLPAQAARRLSGGLRGAQQVEGIGLGLRFGLDPYPVVTAVHAGGPAAKAGIRLGDRLLAIDDADTRRLTPEAIGEKLSGSAGGSVKLSVSSGNSPTPVALTLTRAAYTVPVYEASVLPGGIGYVRLTVFAETFDAATLQAVWSGLLQKGATSLLLDVRDNPGGSGAGAVALLSALVGPNQVLFTHVNRDGSTEPMRSISNAWPSRPPLAVLINERSGSASEIVAAVAQDYGVARVFGVRSHGCLASVEVSPLSDGSALGITRARVVTAKGRSLNRIGVSPDVQVDLTLADLTRGVDTQLERAVAWLKTGS